MLRLCLGEAMRIKRLASSVSAAKLHFFFEKHQANNGFFYSLHCDFHYILVFSSENDRYYFFTSPFICIFVGT